MKDSRWPETLQARLVALWNAGLSPRQIALEPEFLGFSRNAVIGKIWRLRHVYPDWFRYVPLPRCQPAPRARKRRPLRHIGHNAMGEFGSKRPRIKPAPLIELPADIVGTPLLELEPNGCRFIVSSWDGRVPTHLYCGRPGPAAAGDPPLNCYCDYHEQRMRSRG